MQGNCTYIDMYTYIEYRISIFFLPWHLKLIKYFWWTSRNNIIIIFILPVLFYFMPKQMSLFFQCSAFLFQNIFHYPSSTLLCYTIKEAIIIPVLFLLCQNRGHYPTSIPLCYTKKGVFILPVLFSVIPNQKSLSLQHLSLLCQKRGHYLPLLVFVMPKKGHYPSSTCLCYAKKRSLSFQYFVCFIKQ